MSPVYLRARDNVIPAQFGQHGKYRRQKGVVGIERYRCTKALSRIPNRVNTYGTGIGDRVGSGRLIPSG